MYEEPRGRGGTTGVGAQRIRVLLSEAGRVGQARRGPTLAPWPGLHRGATGSRRQREAGGVGGQEISAGRPPGEGRNRLSGGLGDRPLLNVNAKHINGYLDRALELR
jgi:hypothetical protein